MKQAERQRNKRRIPRKWTDNSNINNMVFVQASDIDSISYSNSAKTG